MPAKRFLKFYSTRTLYSTKKTSLLPTVNPASSADPETLELERLHGKFELNTPTNSLEITKGLSDEACNDTN